MNMANSSTLPDLFRHKSTKVRVFQPKVILLDFHGTISERRWEDKVIFPYVKQTVGQYLNKNWYNDAVQHCFFGLRNESFEQRFRNKYEDCPVISDVTKDRQEVETDVLITQVSDFLIWQMNTKKETKDTQVIERLVWRDGLTRQQIKVPIYDDVLPCVQTWRIINKCRIYLTSSIDEETLRLLFANTDKGDLNQLIDGYLSSRKSGDKLSGDLYKRFYEEITKTNKADMGKKAKEIINKKDSRGLDSKHSVKSPASSPTHSLRSETSGTSILTKHMSTSSEAIYSQKPILFLTDSGQEAKAASQVADGLAYECLLVNRPGNRKIRSYYLSHFSYIDLFSDIQFVSP